MQVSQHIEVYIHILIEMSLSHFYPFDFQ